MSPPSDLMGLDTKIVAKVTVGGRKLAHITRLDGRSAVISFDVPGSTAGKRITVTAFVSVGGYDTQRSVTFVVR